ncbi:MAG: 16S rRNA (adenine(1518)-N(6)/adenine(1519)-N(6))-dimethyltransferase RsmA [Betaproteobacteria bacterium]|nr:16S rRNA (adenine(1518)-N(6)/adenine(1519)-N(6))-dimethyltransferase RsmA [Betaproteobacteria bacterium]
MYSQSTHAHKPRKRFGQNFLTDHGVIHAILAAIAPQRGDAVVEIGPGLGALTTPLARLLDHLHVIEIDRDLIAKLSARFPPEQLTIHEGDALAFDFASLGEAENGWRIVGNLPYNISTPLLFHLASFANQVRDMHFMLQREVVLRIVAAPGSRDYGRLSVMLQYRFDCAHLFDVPPEAFSPKPQVDSAIVRLRPRPAQRPEALDPAGETLLASLVSAAFSQRRKMLRNTLRDFLSPEDFASLAIDPQSRAEMLPLSDYIRIVRFLAQRNLR